MTQQPPRRLLDDPSVAAQLRGDLVHARAHPTGYDPEAGLSALRTALDGLAPGGPVDGRASRGDELTEPSRQGAEWSESLRAVATRWWGWTAVGLATVGAVWWSQHTPLLPPQRAASERAAMQVEAEREASQPAGARAEAVATAALDAQVAVAAQATLAAQSEYVAPAKVASRAPSTRAKSAVSRRGAGGAESAVTERATSSVQSLFPVAQETASSRETDAATKRASEPASRASSEPRAGTAEVEHLARVRRLLATEPHEALAAAREGQKTFAQGLLVEERAGLIVFALARLERTDEALREGRSFLRAHPDGPFAARVRAIVTRIEGLTP